MKVQHANMNYMPVGQRLPGYNHGFTLVEMLVSVCVIAILIAITLPAVQSAREASRRATCVNNLKEIGIANSNHISSAGLLPSAVGPGGFSPHTTLLRDLEQTNTFNSFNFQLGATSLSNTTSYKVSLATFICPSDIVSEVSNVLSYPANCGYGFQVHGSNGPFSTSSHISPSQITDGMSFTVGFAEWAIGWSSNPRYPSKAVFRTPVRRTSPSEFDRFVLDCSTLNPELATVSSLSKGAGWPNGEYGASLYNHNITPNGHSCFNKDLVEEGAWTAGSMHAGGSNVLFLDGHVSFVHTSVNPIVWRALGSRAGAEVFNPADF
jgi:prepilin-type N-terminal cleavage/methylation domain-containing protein/prepilin-type processing-associated H-X9-DG protein